MSKKISQKEFNKRELEKHKHKLTRMQHAMFELKNQIEIRDAMIKTSEALILYLISKAIEINPNDDENDLYILKSSVQQIVEKIEKQELALEIGVIGGKLETLGDTYLLRYKIRESN